MKKIFSFVPFLFILLVVGCLHYKISTPIKPKVTIIGNIVALHYELGNTEFTSQTELNSQLIEYIRQHPDASFSVEIEYDDERNRGPRFQYYVDGVLFYKTFGNSADAKTIYDDRNSIPNFKCISDCEVEHKITPIENKQIQSEEKNQL
jgi:hypothetical protein